MVHSISGSGNAGASQGWMFSIGPKSQFVSIDKSSRFNWNSSVGGGCEGAAGAKTVDVTSATGARVRD